VGLTVGVGVGVGVGLGVGVETNELPYSNAPMSQAVCPGAGRGYPRWSVAGHWAAGIAAIAGLLDRSAIVCVGPPLFCSPAELSFGSTLFPMLWPLAATLVPRPQVLSLEILYPLLIGALPAQLPFVLPDRIEFVSVSDFSL